MVVQATVVGGVEKRRFVLFVAQGAAPDTAYDIVIDGTTVGSVTSTKQGKVMFKSLPDTVRLENIDLLTIAVPGGAAVMQADF